jgi:hypothetical protein
MSETSTCRSCGADLIWVVMHPSGKRMPLDARAEKRIVIDPLEAGLTSGAPTARVVNAYTSHFSSCPNAASHRKGKP